VTRLHGLGLIVAYAATLLVVTMLGLLIALVRGDWPTFLVALAVGLGAGTASLWGSSAGGVERRDKRRVARCRV
jgi:hypothetical protein